jgi:hypothetical protein
MKNIKTNRIGETFINTNGYECVIVEYKNKKQVTVEFDNGYRTTTTYQNIKNGKVKRVPIEHIGEQYVNKYGSTFTIVEYRKDSTVVIEFECGYRITTSYDVCKHGCALRSPFCKTVHGIGYFGVLSDGTIPNTNHESYRRWHGMFDRCYSGRYESYKNCTVDESLQCFAYYVEHEHEIQGYNEMMENPDVCYHLDKDIWYAEQNIETDHKVYSLETIRFVPQTENQSEVGKRAGFGNCKNRRKGPLSEQHKQRIGKANGHKICCIETGQVFDCIKDANEWCGKKCVSDCCRGKCKTAGGYHWMYLEDYIMHINNNNEQLLAD